MQILAQTLGRHRSLALVDFPDIGDCGDHAVWLGEKALLAGAGLAPPVYECSAESYDAAVMRARLGDGAILVHGRANPPARAGKARDFLLRLLGDFPDNAVILLPRQWAHRDEETLHALAAAMDGRRAGLTAFATTPASRDFLARHFGDTVCMEPVPDSMLLLGPQARPVEPVFDIVWLARTDAERRDADTEAAARLSSQAAEKFAMPVFPDGVELSFVVKQRPPTVLLSDWRSLVFDNEQARIAMAALDFDAKARATVGRAKYLLSLGHMAITDRLHAHGLALLLGIPHVLMDNASARNGEFYRAWTQVQPLCRLASSPAEAWGLARQAMPSLKEAAAKGEQWSWT